MAFSSVGKERICVGCVVRRVDGRTDSLYVVQAIGLSDVTLLNIYGESFAFLGELEYVGEDTISGLRKKSVSVPAVPQFKVNDWVRHPEFRITGQVIECQTDGKIKIEHYSSDRSKYIFYVWDPRHVHLTDAPPRFGDDSRRAGDPQSLLDDKLDGREYPDHPFGHHGQPGSGSLDWEDGGFYNRVTGGNGNGGTHININRYKLQGHTDPPPTKRTKRTRKSTAPKTNDSISTAGLIQSEVRKLEREEKTTRRPLRTSAPTRSRVDDDDPVLELRQGDWGPSTSGASEEPKASDEELAPIKPRKPSW